MTRKEVAFTVENRQPQSGSKMAMNDSGYNYEPEYNTPEETKKGVAQMERVRPKVKAFMHKVRKAAAEKT